MQVVFVIREFPPLLPPPRCERCGTTEGVAMEPSRTQYMRDPTPWEERAARKRFRMLDTAYRLGGQEAVVALGAPVWGSWEERYFVSWPRPDEVANAPLSLCRPCAEEHHANWDEQWREYYSSISCG